MPISNQSKKKSQADKTFKKRFSKIRKKEETISSESEISEKSGAATSIREKKNLLPILLLLLR